MYRNFGTGILIVCFISSNMSLGWASQPVDVPAVIVQPYELQELNQQMINRDRQNRDEEIAIKQLVEQNNKLTQNTLAHQQDEGLAKINKTMLNYRDTLYSRDHARIAGGARYGDLVALTEDADAVTVHRDLENRSGLLSEKYQMLTQLKDEMTALNEKLMNRQQDSVNQKETVIDGFKKIAQEQQDKIQMLVSRLDELDKKINQLDSALAEKDHEIMQLRERLSAQKDQIDLLQMQAKTAPASLPAAQTDKDQIIKEKQDQVDLLKSELENKISQLPAQQPVGPNEGNRNAVIKQQQQQITDLKVRLQELTAREGQIKSQTEQLAHASEQFKDNGAEYAGINDQVTALRTTARQQELDLKAKDDSIRWLHQVLAAAKQKAEYYRLGAKISQAPARQMQQEMQGMKAEFASKEGAYHRMDSTIASLKDQMAQMSAQLSKKEDQLGLLKSELENKITEAKAQGLRDTQLQDDLKGKLQDKENQVGKMKSDIQAMLQDEANKEIYRRHAARADDRLILAKQLIDLQGQEASLLEEKSDLEAEQNTLFDKHVLAIENRIKGLLARHRLQRMDLQDRTQELTGELSQKEQEADSLKAELTRRIAQEKNQGVLEDQVQDLQKQLQGKDARIADLTARLKEGPQTQSQMDALKQELAAAQDKSDQLKQQLAQSDQMTAITSDYQKKLEDKNNAYNDQAGQIANLNARLQKKEAEIIKLKKRMDDVQASAAAKDKDSQASDLGLAMVQQKMMDKKTVEYQAEIDGLHAATVKQAEEITRLRTDLALARQELNGMPSSDEIEFLRTGLKKTTAELKQKSDMLNQIKGSADEYTKEFKEQSKAFQSLKQQLLDAQEQIQHRDEDLKYKDLAVARLKQEMKGLKVRPHGNRVEDLQAELKSAKDEIKHLKTALDQWKSSFKKDTLEAKLQQALDKINQQGEVINVLVQKLQDSGKKVDLTHI